MTTSYDLTDRYVHATMRDLPEPRRADLARELRSTIQDMVEGNVASGMTPHDAEDAALRELGHPATLAAQYLDGPAHLIGPRFYGLWRRLLRTLLTWVPALIVTITVVVDLVEGSEGVAAIVGGAVATALMAVVQICFWVTLVFAVLERTKEGAEVLEWSPGDLPDLPAPDQPSFAEAVSSAAFSLAVAALLVAQHFITWVGNRSLPLLDPDLWSGWLPFLVVVAVASAALELVRHWAGWNVGTFLATVVTSLAMAAPVAWLATQHRLLNPAFVEEVSMGAPTYDVVMQVVAVGAVAVALWEIGEAAWRTFLRPAALAS